MLDGAVSGQGKVATELEGGRMPDHRSAIIKTFAGWTALSALRSGSPIKSRSEIYPLLRLANFETLLDAPAGCVTRQAFADWHAATVERFCQHRTQLCVGWAAKLVNVYLKTAAYVGGLGPQELVEHIHPPIDGGLWAGLEAPLRSRPAIRARTHSVQRINQITDYAKYSTIIEGCRDLASELGCLLIEVEQFWAGADLPTT
jgi:hypothetical protein